MTDLAKAIERNRSHATNYITYDPQAKCALRTVCDAAECASRVSVEDVEKVIDYELDMPLDCVMRAVANNVMALLRGEG